MAITFPLNSAPTILIADSDKNTLFRLEAALDGPDVNILAAESAKQALDFARENTLALMILNAKMPLLHGFDLGRQLKRLDHLKHIPLMYLTDFDKDQEFIHEGYRAGAVDFLYKPVDLRVLQQKVDTFLSIERSKRELHREIEFRKELEDQLRQARDEADQANKMKTQFLANMSHEIRNHMHLVMGMADVLRESDLDEDQSQCLGTLTKAGGSLKTLLNDLLDVSRIEEGKLSLQREPLDLPQLVNTTADMLRFQVEAKGLSLKVVVGDDLPQVILGDSTRLRQILVNLVGNSIKFTQKGSIYIQVTARKAPHPNRAIVQFSVADTGIGIPQQDLDTIFNPFVQATHATVQEHKGVGLGLAICYRLVNKMKGELKVDSEEGKGSVFSFDLEFTTADIDVLEGEMARLVISRGHDVPERPYRLLVVDDAEDNRYLMTCYLQHHFCDVTLCENGQEAFEAVKAAADEPYDMLIMDIQMPIMTGHEAIRAIRGWERETQRAAMPAVALSAYGYKDDVERSLEAGFNNHIVKPLVKDRLIHAIETFLGPLPEKDEIEAAQETATLNRKVDPDIMDLVPWFLDAKRKEIGEIRDAMGRGDFPVIQRLAHNMKGTGEGYGFPEITDWGKRMELLASQEKGAPITSLLLEMEYFIDHVIVEEA